VVVSGTGMIGDVVEALHRGAWDYLLKPIEDLSVLRHAVDRALERARLLRKNRAYQKHLEGEVARRTEELERTNEELSQLNLRLRRVVEATRKLSACSRVDQLGSRLLEEFARQMQAAGGSLYLLEEGGLRLVHALDPGHAPEFISYPLREGSILQRTLAEGQPTLLHDVSVAGDITMSGWTGYRDGSLLAFPLSDDEGRIVGLLSLHGKSAPPFVEQDKEIGSILASYSSEALRAARATEALRESEQRYRSLVANLPVGIYRSTVDGDFITANPTMAGMFGYDCEEEFLRVRLSDFHADDAEREGFSRRLLTLGKVVASELRMKKKDGELWWSALTANVVRDDAGRIAFIDGLIEDVSARKRAEADRERLGMAIEQASEVVLITDTEGCITYVNPAFEKVSGYRRGEVLGINPRVLKSGEHDEAFYRELWETISSGRTWTGRLVNQKKDGSRYTEEATISPIRSPLGEIVSYVAVKRDITAELSLEAQLHQARKMESIGRLAGSVAHDFNNLLFPILGYAQMLLPEFSPDDPRRDQLMQIQAAAKRARDLNRQLLAFSRKQVLKMVSVNLGQVISGFEKMLRPATREDVELDFRLAPGLGNIRADISQLEQILMNLVVNAQDAMPHGGRLVIEATEVQLDETFADEHPGFRPGPHVLLTVSDTGCGMDREVREQVFEPFFTTKKPGKGTGLGLATVHGIVKQHGGSIRVDSEPGRGTTFKVYFPRVTEAVEGTPLPEARPETGRSSETVLVVEDDEAARRLVCAILRKHGFTVIDAGNAEESLRLVERHQGPVHLLLTDVVMPQMSGRELYRRLVASLPHLRVLYMSGYTEDVIAHHGVLEDGVDLVQKPVSVEVLAGKVREVLDRSDAGG
ncbi:MAG: PAS domain S-box protein, partial [bacterium]|nr:PAS domain S-box protein [bacterium]